MVRQVQSVDDALEDAELLSRFSDQISRWLASAAGDLRGADDPWAGTWCERLISLCPPTVRLHLRAMLTLEGSSDLRDEEGFEPLVVLGSVAVEAVLTRLVLAPSLTLAEEVVDALKSANQPADVIKFGIKWADGTCPSTMATASIVLRGLRDSCIQERPLVQGLLESIFGEAYVELLVAGGLIESLDDLRTDFRNKAMHARASGLTREEYETFCNLAFASRSLRGWVSKGPEWTTPDSDRGIFHHHLANAVETGAAEMWLRE